MPSASAAQERLMAAVAHDPVFAKKVGIPQSVGEEFNAADRAMHPDMLLHALRQRAAKDPHER